MTLVHTLKEVAEHFSARANTVTDWKKSGAPLGKAPYDLDEVQKWLDQRPPHGRQKRVAKTNHNVERNLSEEKKQEEIEILRLKKRLIRYKAAVEKGELIKFSEAEQARIEQATAFKNEILNLRNNADKFLAKTNRQDIVDVLDNIGTDILTRLYQGAE